MRLVSTRRLLPDAVLARDVFTGRHGSVPLLRAGTSLSRRYARALERAGISAVYVDDALSDDIDVVEALRERTRRQATVAIEQAFAQAPVAFASGSALPESTVSELRELVGQIIADIACCGDAVVALADLAEADAYTHQHSIDVAALGLLLGQRLFQEYGWIDYRGRRRFDDLERRLTQLGVGLLLHDIGKAIIPRALLNKPGPLEPEEWELVRQHPRAGVDLLPGTLISALAKTVIRSHHERWDGSGYPDGKRGSKIHQFARIAAVADVFDAITSERPYSPARPAQAGVQLICEGSGSAFDPEVVAVFRKLVAPYPVGTEITLGDGRRGVVVAISASAIERPLVRVGWDADGNRIEPYELDLAREPHLEPAPLNTKRAA
jgi:HD-GYP domain-containing protein (c-di-GMP phosphodiesterase class II)